VLLNLLGNAVKYNRDYGRVELGCRLMPNGRMRISVTDTGPGIAPDKLALVFTPFERLGADKTGIEGTGLGLALARGLVDAMGGELGIDSTLGEGSTFWIELDHVSAPIESIDAAPQQSPADTRVPTQSVLYIEDNLSNVRLVERILAYRSHIRPIIAMQGDLGVELARQHQPNLVLLDLNLPDLDGEAVLARLKADPATRDIPVVVVSADATTRQIERLCASGAADYLTKPLDIEQFLRVVDEHLGEGTIATTKVTTVRLPRADRARHRLDEDILRGLDELVDAPTHFADVARTFKDESGARLDALYAAIATSDRNAIHELAQSLKGIAGTFGDMDTISVCTSLQRHAPTSDIDALSSFVDDLARSLQRAYSELDDHLRDTDARA
jgi:CheY-like chemotaxis protein